MLEGNIHLSSDLRRLAYVRLLVWLVGPRTYMDKTSLIKKYRETIQNYNKNDRWNIHPSGENRPGKGMGYSELPSGTDSIAFNHLVLAQDLEFIKKGSTFWDKNGYVLASLTVDQKNRPLFSQEPWLRNVLEQDGFVAKLGKGEQFVFSTALLEVDVDKIIPLLMLIDEKPNNIADNFLRFVDKWLQRKIVLEPNSVKRGKLELKRRDLNQKIERLDVQNKTSENKNDKIRLTANQRPIYSSLRRDSGSVKIYCQEQTSPRLHFLRDLEYIEKGNNGSYNLTQKGVVLKKTLVDPLFNEKDLHPSIIDTEIQLLSGITNALVEGLPILDYEKFRQIFSSVSDFYVKSGGLLLSYFNVFKSTVSRAIDGGEGLSLGMFDTYMSELVQQKEVMISTSGRGSKYIKVYGKLSLTKG